MEIVKNEYDQVGQLKTKYVGKKKDDNGNYSTNEIEKLIYDYNNRAGCLAWIEMQDYYTRSLPSIYTNKIGIVPNFWCSQF